MVKIEDMGFTWSKLILLLALVSFLQHSGAAPPTKKQKVSGSALSGPASSGSASSGSTSSSVVTPLGITKPPCAPGSTTFDITTNNVQQITVCFDYTHLGAIWTYHEINGQDLNDPNNQKGDRSNNWRARGLENDVTVNQALNLIHGRTVKEGYKNLYKKKVNGKNPRESAEYFARGHLAPNGDFATPVERAATFEVINAAPQWQYFNGNGKGQWQLLEKMIRDYAQKGQGKSLHVITGTYGVWSDNSGYWYLDWSEANNGNNKIPVPEFFWKIVYDGKEGAAFVGSNQDRTHPKYLKNKPPKAVNQNKSPTDQCPGMYGDKDKGIIWCYKIKDIFKVLPELDNYAFPLNHAMLKNAKLPNDLNLN